LKDKDLKKEARKGKSQVLFTQMLMHVN